MKRARVKQAIMMCIRHVGEKVSGGVLCRNVSSIGLVGTAVQSLKALRCCHQVSNHAGTGSSNRCTLSIRAVFTFTACEQVTTMLRTLSFDHIQAIERLDARLWVSIRSSNLVDVKWSQEEKPLFLVQYLVLE